MRVQAEQKYSDPLQGGDLRTISQAGGKHWKEGDKQSDLKLALAGAGLEETKTVYGFEG